MSESDGPRPRRRGLRNRRVTTVAAVPETGQSGLDAPEPAPRRGILALLERPLTLGFVATLGVLGALIIGVALGSITTLLLQIALALFIALGLDPIVRSLERRGMKRGAGIGIVFGGYALVAAAFLFFILPPVVTQIAEFVEHLPQAVDEMVTSDWFRALPLDLQVAFAGGVHTVADTLHQPETLAAIGGGVLAAAAGLFNAISAGFIIVALTLYFLASLDGMKQGLYSLVPAHDRGQVAGLTEQVTASVGASLLGSLTLSALNGVVVFFIYYLAGLPYAALMALIAFIITFIPLFGSLIFLVLGSVVALFSSPTQALIFLVAYFIYIQVESYVVSPRVMTKAISIPPALVLIGAMAGAAMLGVIGVLLALPVIASLLLIIRQVVIPKQNLKV
ncbi:AI-2E family transporter [Microbacterium sp. B35-30]|jgi:predicted PurR-regulated permease PerM|uniref:AI-2E family transporter n=1 Tax=Microbacterium sp. B35-30 TaxID=1962642 RepID=UPI0013D365C6|nr:AI-2E family transporter [Microbacterium sp. B35-30]